MSISKLFKLASCAAALAATCFSANATVVTYTGDTIGGPKNSIYGSFSGVDANNDGKLTFSELTSFDFEYPGTQYLGIDLNDLSSFGSYTIGSNTWSADASGWGQPSGFWFSFSGGSLALNNKVFTVSTALQAEVPEPLTLGLFGIGLVGLGLARRRQQ